jgi:uncharacterized protein YutE (UPF0331/DUF86 family)
VRPSTLRRLERFNKGIEILEELKNYRKENFCEDLKVLSMAERNLQVCAEFIVDLSAYVLSKLGVGAPETYREVVERVHAVDIIDEGLKQKLFDVVGPRNIIVHMYADVRAELIYENLDDLISTLKNLFAELLEFCEERGIDP